MINYFLLFPLLTQHLPQKTPTHNAFHSHNDQNLANGEKILVDCLQNRYRIFILL